MLVASTQDRKKLKAVTLDARRLRRANQSLYSGIFITGHTAADTRFRCAGPRFVRAFGRIAPTVCVSAYIDAISAKAPLFVDDPSAVASQSL